MGDYDKGEWITRHGFRSPKKANTFEMTVHDGAQAVGCF